MSAHIVKYLVYRIINNKILQSTSFHAPFICDRDEYNLCVQQVRVLVFQFPNSGSIQMVALASITHIYNSMDAGTAYCVWIEDKFKYCSICTSHERYWVRAIYKTRALTFVRKFTNSLEQIVICFCIQIKCALECICSRMAGPSASEPAMARVCHNGGVVIIIAVASTCLRAQK